MVGDGGGGGGVSAGTLFVLAGPLGAVVEGAAETGAIAAGRVEAGGAAGGRAFCGFWFTIATQSTVSSHRSPTASILHYSRFPGQMPASVVGSFILLFARTSSGTIPSFFLPSPTSAHAFSALRWVIRANDTMPGRGS